jgi:hypothetical protein
MRVMCQRTVLLLCLAASTAKQIQLAISSTHRFVYDDAESSGGHPPDRLEAAAFEFCTKHATELNEGISVSECARVVAENAATSLTAQRASDPRAAAPPLPPGHPGRHGLTSNFLEVVLPLYRAGFGTEQMAPLLHALVRFHRPHTVVELGYGYTTPFIAQALADNVANAAAEWSNQRGGGEPHVPWYAERLRAGRPTLHVIDDGSQRTDEMAAFASKMESTLRQLGLYDFVRLSPSLDLGHAHTMFEPDSLGMVWNDAQWDPMFLRLWWPLLKKDGGVRNRMLLRAHWYAVPDLCA